ncbi:TGF-beta-activated kinase 1 and MAP3K7-binding protein 1-like [Limulus polyphemus]|uniref:TGF-beta-activated kinase 1 and MAP3K7-binding protein 1-like n=1 Tax=Limulus polyphemus TaxID=6850 RepID=A0ABM1TCS4_LIMPO|nr:TGF-beta-activated kinase 1 and MAP3K7-binding protein 1-like [Limulus polyphemus]
MPTHAEMNVRPGVGLTNVPASLGLTLGLVHSHPTQLETGFSRWGGHFFYGVFDGHHGSRTSDFAAQRMPAEILLGQLDGKETDSDVRKILQEAFHAVEKGFFDSIDDLLAEKITLQLHIHGLSDYQAYTKFPDIVNQLQDVIREISAGTAALVALILKNKLYVASVGDCRALLVKTNSDGSLRIIQLTTNHDIYNEDELLRLSHLGLDIEKIRQGNKLGSLHNTRCIGNYMLKGGYTEFDFLSDAKEEPVIAEPQIQGGIEIDKSCQFLVLMSVGVYKSIEEATGTSQVNEIISEMVLEQFHMQSTLVGVAQAVVDKVVRIHHDRFVSGGEEARRCERRNDMTLLVRKFNQPFPNPLGSPLRPVSPLMGLHSPSDISQFKTGLSVNVNPTVETSVYSVYSEAASATVTYSTHTETSSSESSSPFQSSKHSLPLDSDGRLLPYVDFSSYFQLVEEAKLQGHLSEDFIP